MRTIPSEKLKGLAGGINHVLFNLFQDQQVQFMLIVASPADENDEICLSTVTGITNAANLRTIAKHIAIMADEADQPAKLEEFTDDDIKGHA